MKLDGFDKARMAAKQTSTEATRYRHTSVILDRKGRIIATGRNHWAGRLIQAEDDINKTIKKTIHSEIDALSKVNIRRLDGATLINYSRTEVATNLSRPCVNCLAILKKLKLTKVFYSIRSDLINPKWQEEHL